MWATGQFHVIRSRLPPSPHGTGQSDDFAGQVTKRSKGLNAETWTYGYDHRGQLVWAEDRATDGGALIVRAECADDAFGNRVRRTGYDGSLAMVSDEKFALDG